MLKIVQLAERVVDNQKTLIIDLISRVMVRRVISNPSCLTRRLDLPNAIDAEVLLQDITYLDLETDIAAVTDRQSIPMQALGHTLIIC